MPQKSVRESAQAKNAGPARQAAGLQAADGLDIPLGVFLSTLLALCCRNIRNGLEQAPVRELIYRQRLFTHPASLGRREATRGGNLMEQSRYRACATLPCAPTVGRLLPQATGD